MQGHGSAQGHGEGNARGGEGLGTNLEEGTVGALSPQALGAWFILTVLLIDLELLHLQQGGTKGTDPRAELLPAGQLPESGLLFTNIEALYSNPLPLTIHSPETGRESSAKRWFVVQSVYLHKISRCFWAVLQII